MKMNNVTNVCSDQIVCPYCKKAYNPQDDMTFQYASTNGAKRCVKCRKWFTWQENKQVTYTTGRITQGG